MKTITFFSSWTRMAIVLLSIGVLATTSCKKDLDGKSSGGEGGYGNVPHAEVPDPFVGTFTYVTQTGVYVDDNGNHIPGIAQGVTLHIDRNGTGSSLYHVETGSYSGAVTTDEVKCQCTYEIAKTSATTANIIIHYVSGKDYHNGTYLHDLDASKLYPNGDAVWNDAQIGMNSEGKTTFTIGKDGNTAQFTKQ